MKNNHTPLKNCYSTEELKVYLQLSAAERANSLVKKHLDNCSLCAAAAEQLLLIESKELEEDIKTLKKQLSITNQSTNSRTRRLFISRVAAGIAFLTTSAAALFYWNTTSNQRLYQQYFQPYRIIGDHTSRGPESYGEKEELPKSLIQALELYQNGEFAASIPYFQVYRTIQPENSYANLLSGIAHLNTDQTDIAIELLEEVRINSLQYYDDACWYLALAMLKKKNYSEANYYLDQILKTGSRSYTKQARTLKEKLR